MHHPFDSTFLPRLGHRMNLLLDINKISEEETILIDRRALDFIKRMVHVYGVVSCFDNVDEEKNTLEDEGLWFECPHCGEPILIGTDYDLEEIVARCPICEGAFELFY